MSLDPPLCTASASRLLEQCAGLLADPESRACRQLAEDSCCAEMCCLDAKQATPVPIMQHCSDIMIDWKPEGLLQTV